MAIKTLPLFRDISCRKQKELFRKLEKYPAVLFFVYEGSYGKLHNEYFILIIM